MMGHDVFCFVFFLFCFLFFLLTDKIWPQKCHLILSSDDVYRFFFFSETGAVAL